jgi:dCMP deaminase
MRKDAVYLQMAAVQSLLSKDPSTAVGAVLLDRNGVVKGTGYNGFARGVGDDPARYADRAIKLLLVRHAEENCLTVAGAAAQGGTLYSTFAPCARCAAAMVQAQVARVVYPTPLAAFAERWADDLHWAMVQFREAGVEVETILFDAPRFVATIKGAR